MARLTDTRVTHRTGDMPVVGFDTDEGAVQVDFVDGVVYAEIGFDEVPAGEAREVLEDVEGSEHFDDAAADTAHELLDKLAAQEGDSEDDQSPDEEDEDDQDGEVVHVTEDGTEVRVGDKVNHPGGWSYEIVGREDEHTVEKYDLHDDNTSVAVSTLESDIEEQGFDERVEGAA